MKLILAVNFLPLVAAFAGRDSFLQLLTSYGLFSSNDIRTVRHPSRGTYDYIVVGAGSGGSTVANRLSEDPDSNVLLLEAGKPEGILNQVPLLTSAFATTDYNWGYKVEPQTHACLGMTNDQCTWPRGKSLGGTSTINYMIHTRGNKLDFDNWSKLGNDGWSYEEVLPYFKKSEKFKVQGVTNMSYHGTNGNLCVESIPYRSPLATEFLKAGVQLGYKYNEDYNGEEQLGVSYLQVNEDRGSRCSASKAYLTVKRSNLDIVPHAHVTKILINKNKRAYGVEYMLNGKTYGVHASKEVILSAGTIDSAKLLMLSGIGPKEHLEELGIPVLKDAKVGYNLYEHIGFLGPTFLVNRSVTLIPKNIFKPSNFLEYAAHRRGPISLPGGAESLAFIRTKYAEDARPDLEILFASGSLHSDDGLGEKRSHGVSDEVYNKVFRPIENMEGFFVWPICQHPKSFGRITLRSKDPFEAPIIQPNFFKDKRDVEIILQGVKIAIKMMETEPFQAYGTRLHDIKIPGCEDLEFNTDDYWRCGIKQLPAMMNHEIGTAKMGPESDPDAVVDPQLRVYGIKDLRVVDASIMPTLTVGHTNAPTYMIGEKAADMIKQRQENQ